MKKLLIVLSLFSSAVLAHPGHGEPGLLHSHGEWLISLALAFLLWRLLRR